MITRTDIAKQLEYGVRTGFLNGVRRYQPLRAAFVEEVPSTGAFENYADMGDIPWPRQNGGSLGPGGTDSTGHAPVVGSLHEGQGVTMMGADERGLVVYNGDWEITLPVKHNAINDGRVGDLEGWARGAGVNFEKHKDFLVFAALNAGDGTTYGAGYDNLSFFNDSHVDVRAEYTTAQDNKFAVTLSLDNFETVQVAASKFKDGRGQPVGFNHTLLVVPPDLRRIAAQITDNREDNATANRALNPYSGEISRLVAPGGWLDSTAWFLLDVSQAQKPMYLQMRQDPRLVVWDEEKESADGVRYFKLHARYQVFYGDWRLAVMGNT